MVNVNNSANSRMAKDGYNIGVIGAIPPANLQRSETCAETWLHGLNGLHGKCDVLTKLVPSGYD